MASVTLNGNVYSDDDDPNVGLANGGHRTRFVPALRDMIAELRYVRAPGATSSTTAAIGTGSYSFTLNAPATLPAGTYRIAALADPAATMIVELTAPLIAATTLDVTAHLSTGSGSFSAWTIAPLGTTGRRTIAAIAADHILGATDLGALIKVTGGHTVTLLAPALAGSGFTVGLHNVGGGTVGIVGTVDGTAAPTLAPGDMLELYCDGTAWRSTLRPITVPVPLSTTRQAVTAVATTTIDLSLGWVIDLAHGVNITSLSFTNPPASGSYCQVTLIRTAAAAGVSITWPAAINWGSTAPNGPDLSGVNGAVDIIQIETTDGGVSWRSTNLPPKSPPANFIHNGGMEVAQEFGFTAVTLTASNQWPVDRWAVLTTTGSGHTAQKVADAPPGTTLVNSLKVMIGSGASPSSSAYNVLKQALEGKFVARLRSGTANARTVSISFWVKSSLSGTFGGAINNDDIPYATRSYPFSFTISAANTWEYKTLTIPLDTSGTWLTNTSAAMYLMFDLGVGTTYKGAAGAWVGVNPYHGVTGATNLVATNGATFQLTGVNMIDSATPAAYVARDFAVEAAICKRYFQVVRAWRWDVPLSSLLRNPSSDNWWGTIYLPSPMRVSNSAAIPVMGLVPGAAWSSFSLENSTNGNNYTFSAAWYTAAAAVTSDEQDANLVHIYDNHLIGSGGDIAKLRAGDGLTFSSRI